MTTDESPATPDTRVWAPGRREGPLHAVRVVDFGQYLAGPLTAMLLADQGADVIRVEPPGGPRWSSTANHALLRGRRTVELDLRDTADRTRARALARSADVLIENFRPGTMARLGLGADDLLAGAPSLVYCSLPGFSSSDPRSVIPAWEGVLMAAGGGFASPETPGMFADSPPPDDAEPQYSPIAAASVFGALHAATSVVAALIARRRDGLGQRIEVPLSDVLFEASGSRSLLYSKRAPRFTSFGSGVYRCADGRHLTFLANWIRHLEWFLEAVGHTEWITEGLATYERLWSDPDASAELIRRLVDVFATRPALEWEELGRRHGCSLAVVRSTTEWLAEPFAVRSGAVESHSCQLGNIYVPGMAVVVESVGDQGGQAADPPTVKPPGATGVELIAAIDGLVETFPPPVGGVALPSLRTAAPPLDGIRVLEMARVIAAPTSGRLLAELGADVVRLDVDPTTSKAIFEEPLLHTHLNRGKRTVVADVASPKGRDLFERIATVSDVVLQNFTLGAAERLEVGEPFLHSVKPDLVYVYLNAFGRHGSWSPYRGFAETANVASGLTDHVRRGHMPDSGASPIIDLPRWFFTDYATGALGSLAAVLGLYAKALDGRGSYAHTSLISATTLEQITWLVDVQLPSGAQPFDHLGLLGQPGRRIYRARDGWLFLACTEDQLDVVAAAWGSELGRHSVIDALQDACRHLSCDEACAAVIDAGGGAHRIMSMHDLMKPGGCAERRGLRMTLHSEQLGDVTMPGPVPVLSRTPLRPGSSPQPFGADGPAVAAELSK